MQNIPLKSDGSSTLPASEFNQIADELENIITSTGISLSGSDVNQIAKSIANYAANGNFYTDSGVADAYVLTVIGNNKAPTAYRNGLKTTFKVGNTNTGASTINVASLGVKNIKKNNGADDLDANDLEQGKIVELIYDSGGDYFELTSTEIAFADLLKKNETATLTVGFTTQVEALGNSGTGTVTPLIEDGPIKTLTINGSFTLAAPTDTNSGYIEIEATNDATGGYTVTLSGYTEISGSYDSAPNTVNLFRISKIASNSYIEIVQPA